MLTKLLFVAAVLLCSAHALDSNVNDVDMALRGDEHARALHSRTSAYEDEGYAMHSHYGGEWSDCSKDYCCPNGYKCYMWDGGWQGNWHNKMYQCTTDYGCKEASKNSQNWKCDKYYECGKKWDRDAVVEDRRDEGYAVHDHHSGEWSDCSKDYCCPSGYKCYMWDGGWQGNWHNKMYQCTTDHGCKEASKNSKNWKCDKYYECGKKWDRDAVVENRLDEGYPKHAGHGGEWSDCSKDYCCPSDYKCYMWDGGWQGNWHNKMYQCTTKYGCDEAKKHSSGWQCDKHYDC